MVARKIIGAFVVSTSAAALPVQAQICQDTGGKISLGFDVKPSLVVHSDGIMDITFGDANLPGGDQNERLFSFKRTIGTILETASAVGGENTPAKREAFVQTMLDSFATADSFVLNRTQAS
jgi:hypothetical protein